MKDDVLKISIQHSLNYIKAYNHQRLLALDKQFIYAIENLGYEECIESYDVDESVEGNIAKSSTHTHNNTSEPEIEDNSRTKELPIEPISRFNFYLPYVFTSFVILWIFFVAN